MENLKLNKKQEKKLLEMCKTLFPEYNIQNHITYGYNTVSNILTLRDSITDHFITEYHWFEFVMTHLAEKIIATFVINKDNQKVYKRTLNDDLSKFYLESLLFSRGFNKTHPIDYLYIEFKKSLNKNNSEFEIEKKIRKCIALLSDISNLKNEDDLIIELGFDSLDCVELIMNIEKEFSIHIKDENAETLLKNPSIKNFINYLKQFHNIS